MAQGGAEVFLRAFILAKIIIAKKVIAATASIGSFAKRSPNNQAPRQEFIQNNP